MSTTITEIQETFDSWINKEFIPENLRQTLSNASILIIPFEDLREAVEPVFPTGTAELFQYFQANLSEVISIDICISDEEYLEFSFNNNYKRLGKFMVAQIALPVFITVLSAYVYDKFIKEEESKPQIYVVDNSKTINVNNHISTLPDKKYLEPIHIKFNVTIVRADSASINIDYEGPASEFDDALKALKQYEK
jgi:hypothetical protein